MSGRPTLGRFWLSASSASRPFACIGSFLSAITFSFVWRTRGDDCPFRSDRENRLESTNGCAGIILAPDRLAYGEEVCARIDQRLRVFGRDPADRDARNLEQSRPPGQDRPVRAIVGRLGRRRIEGAERHIIRARLAGFHREMAAVVAGLADLRGGPEQRPRLADVAVLLAEVDAVGG